ncbi:hypothetical protein ERJ70_14085 [Sediminibacillus dalangtanensis]|uniref:DUF6305 domain-containing protein n=1 Tax=Sediminibacillus dalangtanensis TaxID=2729421 RepID=A0ABX7VWC4_9BACI|nr:DUF6305 family protein [Sediminibacillus dalangtanensis]QTN00330.1 hypothetical protein ERJ70_14085 [Sediminibacillus dalangtanensis]
MKKSSAVIGCFVVGFLLAASPFGGQDATNAINSYPNLPAPIGEESVLLTSAGQAPENLLLAKIAEDLHLEGDYRPRALASDLYDYRTLVIIVGSSPYGLQYRNRTFTEEMERTKQLLNEAELRGLPVIILHVAETKRQDKQTVELIKATAPHADYFLGLKSISSSSEIIELMDAANVPVTLVKDLEDLHTPLNSAFR